MKNHPLSLHPKVAATGIGGSVSIIILWAISYAIVVPGLVQAAFVAVISAACGWLAPWLPEPPAAKPPKP